MPIDCFDKHAPRELVERFNERVRAANAMENEAMQREIGMELVNEFHKEIHSELNALKKSIGLKQDEYKELSASEKIKKVNEEYDTLIANKKTELENAIQEPSTSSLLQYPQEEIGATRSERGRMEQGEQREIPAKEGKGKGEEEKVGVYVEQPETRITYRGLQETATEFGLEDITKRTHKSDLKLRKEAEDAIREGFDVDGMVDDILVGKIKTISDVDKVVLGQKLANLKQQARGIKDKLSPEYDKVFKEIERYKNAGKIIQGELGAALRDPTFGAKADDSLEAFLIQKKEANDGADLTDKQKEATIKLHEEYEAKLQKEEALRIEAEKKYNDLLAQKELNKAKGTRPNTSKKKTKEDFIAERTKFKEELKAAKEEHELWLKNNGIAKAGVSGITLTPKMVKAISKIVGSHVQEIGSNLAEVTKKVFDDVKDFFEGITEEDIRNVIAGVYNGKRPTLTKYQADLAELKTEAALIKKLEDVKAGVPKTETQKKNKNAKIAALQKELTELKKETGYDDETKLKSIIARNEAQTKKIQEKIDNKDYDVEEKTSFIDNPEFKKKYPDLYKKVLDGITAREEAKHKLALDIYLDQQAKRSKLEKGADFLASIIATSKALVSGIDDSFVLMQNYYAMLANPKTGAQAFKEHALDAFSEKRFNRGLAALHNSKMWDTIQKSGLDVLEPKSLGEGKVEEAFDNNLLNKTFRLKNGKEIDLKKVNFLRPFERMFTSMGNNMRVKLFLDRAQTLRDNGKTFESHPQEYKDAARVINELTGRGKQNKYIEMANPLVTPFIWSPRLISSGLNMLGVSDLISLANGKKWGTEGFYRKLTPAQRNYAFSQIGRGIGTGIGIMGAFWLGGADVDFDPRSVTFGMVTIGNKQINVFGRLAPYVKALAQSFTSTRVKGGEEQDINAGRNPKTLGGIVGGVTRSKVTPFTGFMYDYFFNAKEDYYTKEKMSLSDAPKELLVPIGLQDIKKNLERDGSLAILQFLGSFEGLQISDKRDFNKEDELVDWEEIYTKNLTSKQNQSGADILIRDPKTRVKRKMTPKELEDFQTKRDAYIKKELDDLKKNGKPVWNGVEVVPIPSDKIKNSDIVPDLKNIKSEATEKVKELLFPETEEEKRIEQKAKDKVSKYKKRQQ